MRLSIKIGRLICLAVASGLVTLLVTSCAATVHEDPSKHDADLMDMMAKSTRSQEAMSWLLTNDGTDRTVGKDDPLYTHAQSVQFVQKLYHLGAVNVEAIDITPEGHGEEDTRTLIITMPTDLVRRQNLLNCVNAIETDDGFDAEADDGQRYELIWWG